MIDIQDTGDKSAQPDHLLAIAGTTDWMDIVNDQAKKSLDVQRTVTTIALRSEQDEASERPLATFISRLRDAERRVDEAFPGSGQVGSRRMDDELRGDIHRTLDESWERIERMEARMRESELRLDELEAILAGISRRHEENRSLLSDMESWGTTSWNAQTFASDIDQPPPDTGEADLGYAASEADSILSRASSPACGSVASSDSDDIPLHEERLAASDLVDILTTDGAIISAPRLLLIKYITFFADLPPFLDSTSDHPGASPPFELPSATSGGLELVIGLLRAKYLGGDTDADPSAPERELYFEDLQRIVDALIIADMYDIPAIPAIFAQTSYDSVDGYPLWAWVLGTLAGGHPCIDFPSLIVDTLGVETHQLPSDARAILHHHIPDALAVLEADQARWMGMVDKLLAEWTSLAPMATGINRYTLKCLCRTKRYTKDGPDWYKLRKEIAEGAFEAGLSGGYIYSWNVWNYVDTQVRCETCAERLYNTFRPALVAFRDQCPPRCELQFYCETCYYDAPKDYWTVDGPLVSAWTKQNPGVKKRALYWPYKEGEKVF